MKSKLPILFFFILILATSCKFDYTPAGTYVGEYTAYGFSANSGNGTLKVETTGSDRYDITLVSSGNPDIYFSDIELKRTGGVYGNTFKGGYGNYMYDDTTMDVSVYEHDEYYGNDDHSVDFRFQVSAPSLVSITFTGTR